MRRQYRSSRSPRKQFINSYHVNEVPLPYYNPLEDPYLQGFFTNENVARHLEAVGFVYQARKEYPYEERRLTNCNKFLRNNSCFVPPHNLLKNRPGNLSASKSSGSTPRSSRWARVESAQLMRGQYFSHQIRQSGESIIFSESIAQQILPTLLGNPAQFCLM